MLSKEEIEAAVNHFIDYQDIESAITIVRAMLSGYIIIGGSRKNLTRRAISIILTAYKEIELEKTELEKTNDKYLQKLVYALSPTTHVLGDGYNNAFKKIIAENIDLETYKIKRILKDCWEGRY